MFMITSQKIVIICLILSLVGYEKVSSHVREPHVTKNCRQPRGAESAPSQQEYKALSSTAATK